MRPDETSLPPPSAELLLYLDAAQRAIGEDLLTESYRNHLGGLTSTTQLIEVNRDDRHPLWWFLPPILYDLFDEDQDYDWLSREEPTTRSVIVVPPPFVSIGDQLRREVEALGLTVEGFARSFTPRLVGLLYGGYPWFESYSRICDTRGVFAKECVVLRVFSEDRDVPRTLDVFKKRRRNSFGQPLQMAFDDLPYAGLIRAFHVPARIETRRHVRATEVGRLGTEGIQP
jgi:hypothetical protein